MEIEAAKCGGQSAERRVWKLPPLSFRIYFSYIIFGSYIEPSVYGFQVWEDSLWIYFLLDLFVQYLFGFRSPAAAYISLWHLCSPLSFLVFMFGWFFGRVPGLSWIP